MIQSKFLFFVVLAFIAGQSLGAQESLLRTTETLSDGQAEITVNAPEDSTLRILAVSVDFLPELIVIDEDGNRYEGTTRLGSSAVFFDSAMDQEIRIIVRSRLSHDGAADSEFTLGVNTFPAPPSVELGQRVAESLTATDRLVSANDQRFVDFYRLEVDEGERVNILAESDQLDTYLIIRLPNGEQVVNDDANGRDAGYSFTASEAGVAEIGVTTFSENSTGNYVLSLTEVAPPPVVEVGRTITAQLQPSDDTIGGKLSDLYALEGSAGQSVRVQVSSEDFDTYLIARSTTGYTEENDDGADGTNSAIDYLFSGEETLEIQVTSWRGDSTGSYTLEISEPEPTARLSVGEEITGTIDEEDQTPIMYLLSAPQGVRVRIELESDDFDTVVEIADNTGYEDRDDDGGEGRDSAIRYTFDSATDLRIFVGSFFSAPTGEYTLRVVEE